MSKIQISRLQKLPKPPAFLDPLFSLETSYFYSVPNFHSANHPATFWLLKRILSHDGESIRRKLELSPSSLHHRYFQLVDDPKVYQSINSTECMFHKKCLLYLTPLAMAVYFKSFAVIDALLSYQPTTDSKVSMHEEPQFCSHLQDTVNGDFHAFPIFMIVLRRSVFPAASLLAKAGWQAGKAIAMPLRRRFERRIIFYRDWLDAALGVLVSRPTFPLAMLVQHVTSSPGYNYIRLPIDAVMAKSKLRKRAKYSNDKNSSSNSKDQPDFNAVLFQQPGVLEFGEQPYSVPIVGIRSISELCFMADQLRQLKTRAEEIRKFIFRAKTDGVNEEVMIAQAMEFIRPDPHDKNDNYFSDQMLRSQSSDPSNSNNHAAPISSELLLPEQKVHCSEPVRILLLGLERSRFRQQCLEAVSVYVSKRNYFICSQMLSPSDGRSRDLRNFVVCLLNILANEQTDIDMIDMQIKAGHKRRRALESLKGNKNGVIKKICGILMEALISSKQIVRFLSAADSEFPPYPAGAVDFALNPQLAKSMANIRYGVLRVLNAKRDAWKSLKDDILKKAVQDSEILWHFKVGRPPTQAELEKQINKDTKIGKRGSKAK